jgi:deoxyribose-phosphate aldolase
MPTITELAKLLDHSVLHPTATDADLQHECEIAKQYQVASVCVKPYHVKLAAVLLQNSTVLVGCVVGFPAGNSSIETKVFETEQACKNGAVEIDMVINIGKALQEDWEYIQKEIAAVVSKSREYGAITKVIFETDYIPSEKHIKELCQICTTVGAEYVKTSTGFGYTKQENGMFTVTGATKEAIEFFKLYSGKQVKIKASGGIRTLDQLLMFAELGISRCGTSATIAILEEAKKRNVIL